MTKASPTVLDVQERGPCRLIRDWNRFWFTPGDPTTLGLIRICCGLFVLYVHLAYTVDLQEFMGKHAWIDLELANEFRHEVPWGKLPDHWEDAPPILSAPKDEAEAAYIETYKSHWGSDPRKAYVKGNCVWSIWFHVTDPDQMNVVHWSILGIMFLFTIGFCTRITSVLTWLGALSYIQRSPTTVFGMDAIMSVTLFYLMIGPSGAALSVDRLIARYWLMWQALRRHRPAPVLLRPTPLVAANVALRLMQVHFCIIYFAAGSSKLLGGAWWNGTAIWGTLVNYEFAPMTSPLYMAVLHFLCDHRWLWEMAMSTGVLFTLALELSFPFLVWLPRWRGLMVTTSVLLHTVIAVLMGLVGFGLIMFSLVLSFVPGDTVRRFLQVLGHGATSLQLLFNGQSRRQLRVVSLVHAFDILQQVELHESSSPNSIETDHLQLITPAGDLLTGYALFERLVRSIRLLWPLALITWLPGMAFLGKKEPVVVSTSFR